MPEYHNGQFDPITYSLAPNGVSSAKGSSAALDEQSEPQLIAKEFRTPRWDVAGRRRVRVVAEFRGRRGKDVAYFEAEFSPPMVGSGWILRRGLPRPGKRIEIYAVLLADFGSESQLTVWGISTIGTAHPGKDYTSSVLLEGVIDPNWVNPTPQP